MADLRYLTKNRLEQRANRRRGAARRSVVLLGLPLIALALTESYALGVAVTLVVVVCYITRPHKQDKLALAGSEGEEVALSWLKGLPEGYTVFNNVIIPSARSRTGFREADLVVCEPGAVFVLEVKHNKGSITCDESLPEWPVHKVGRGGTTYTTSMRNPVWQVKGFTKLLVGHLKAHNARVWVQPLVVFTHPEAELDRWFESSTSGVPILRSEEINDTIRDNPGRGQASDR